ncbi:hypothetical protein GUJ93_ZPchr0006g44416 [Zizania palustris]|uniref:Uncharacterized protein n=1 Tax=Zizania palustris TaxID=103762 RepID=A0A8J5VM06_ZIZPA|nr:hypothetical protein GUJ93_ZPchr0006g44416 [Zizania palustris]
MQCEGCSRPLALGAVMSEGGLQFSVGQTDVKPSVRPKRVRGAPEDAPSCGVKESQGSSVHGRSERP